jgi:MFS family permease
VCLFSPRLLGEHRVRVSNLRPDVAGAVTVTAALILLDYAIVSSADVGVSSRLPLLLSLAGAVLLAVFVRIEARASTPLVPLTVFRLRNFTVANLAAILWASAIFAWFSITAVYLQSVQGYDTMQVALAFLPPNLIMAAFSLGLSAKLITRFGLKLPLITGLAMTGIGLVLLAAAPVGTNFMFYLMPAMALYGIGSGIGYNPLVLAAMQDVGPAESGLASGVINTSFLIGGGLGLAALASLAASRAHSLMAQGVPDATALSSGYQLSFLVGAASALLAAVLATTLLSKATVPSPNAAETSA